MPLPSGTVPVAPSAADTPPPPAFLVRFPEDTWRKLASSDGGVTITVGDDMTLNLPGEEPIRLDSQTAQQSELYAFDTSANQLAPIGVADARLSVPFSAASTIAAAEKVRLQNAALDAQRNARAARVLGTKPPPAPSSSHSRQSSLSNLPQRPSPSPAPAMSRALSGPAASTLGSSMGEKIPLKTRVVQFLALGPTTVDEILDHTQGDYNDVLRVANVIGLQEGGQYRLRPAQYAKIKIGSWKYTHEEKVRVIALARQAFDELGLAPDAEERDELDQKEREALGGSAGSGGSRAGSTGASPAPPPHVSPVKAKQLSLSPQKPLPTLSRSTSPAEKPAPAPKKAAAASKTAGGGPKSKVAKEIAKLRNDHLAKARSSSAGGGSSRVASPRLDSDEEKPLAAPAPAPAPAKKPREPKEAKEPRQPRATVSAAAAAAAGLPEKPVAAIERSRSKQAPAPAAENGKRKRDEVAAAAERPLRAPPARERERPERGRKSTHDYTSSESESDAPAARRKPAAKPASNGKANGAANGSGRGAAKRTSPVYTSSEDDAPPPPKRRSPPERAEAQRASPPDRERDRLMPAFRRRGSPVTTTVTTTKVRKSNGAGNGSPAPPTSGAPDPRGLREKYERLYAEYERVGERLAGIYHAAERVRDGSPAGDLASRADVRQSAERYEELHRELEKIRAWFG